MDQGHHSSNSTELSVGFSTKMFWKSVAVHERDDEVQILGYVNLFWFEVKNKVTRHED